jgi:hypothetical protein
VGVSPASEQAAKDTVDDHHATWRLRNVKPKVSDVARLAQAYLRGDAAGGDYRSRPPPAGDRVASQHLNPRLDLIYQRLRSLAPSHPASETDTSRPASETDADFASGDHRRAAEGYGRRIVEHGDSGSHVWAGFAVSYGRSAGVHIGHPELLRAVYRHLTGTLEHHARPEQVAAWLYRGPTRR